MDNKTLFDIRYKTILESINLLDPLYKKRVAFNQRETAQIIGVSNSTLENWRREGICLPFKKVDNGKRGRVLYLKTDIAEWLSKTNVVA